MINIVHNCDNMQFMAGLPDGYFDLVIDDPPNGEGNKITAGGTWSAKYKGKDSLWNYKKPDKEYIKELLRISKNQIIWCAIYFCNLLPVSKGWIIWEKLSISESFTMAMAEFAWSSYDINAKIFKSLPEKNNRFHPSQKPVVLYKWLLQNYAKPGWKIGDMHVGSGSSRIACHDMGFDFEGCELDGDYWAAQEDRYKNHIANPEIFDQSKIQAEIYRKQGEIFNEEL